MSTLVKYAGIAIAIQLIGVVVLFLGVRTWGTLAVIDFYYPTILVITKVGGFTGESTMMLPVFFGIPLGILIYGIVIGLIFRLFKGRQT